MKKFVKSVIAGLTVLAVSHAFASGYGLHQKTGANDPTVGVINQTVYTYTSYDFVHPPVYIGPVGTREANYYYDNPYNSMCLKVVRQDNVTVFDQCNLTGVNVYLNYGANGKVVAEVRS